MAQEGSRDAGLSKLKFMMRSDQNRVGLGEPGGLQRMDMEAARKISNSVLRGRNSKRSRRK